ncbi:MAG: hypothetical protein ABI760_24360 [Ferruginibacter sp.]
MNDTKKYETLPSFICKSYLLYFINIGCVMSMANHSKPTNENPIHPLVTFVFGLPLVLEAF